MQQIKSLNVIQAAKILAALYFVFGLAFAVLCVFLALVERGHSGHRGLAMAVLSPFFYGVAGFVLGAVFCWLYNLIATRFGGLELEITDLVQTRIQS